MSTTNTTIPIVTAGPSAEFLAWAVESEARNKQHCAWLHGLLGAWLGALAIYHGQSSSTIVGSAAR